MSGEDSNSYPLDVLKTDADTDHEVIDLGFRIKTFALYIQVSLYIEHQQTLFFLFSLRDSLDNKFFI